ncbi:MAG: hypothetical protein IJC63_08935, partial [Myxococcaceae bacterium]|nr:hypothetical protein [Myxococcaceae bacterium]
WRMEQTPGAEAQKLNQLNRACERPDKNQNRQNQNHNKNQTCPALKRFRIMPRAKTRDFSPR